MSANCVLVVDRIVLIVFMQDQSNLLLVPNRGRLTWKTSIQGKEREKRDVTSGGRKLIWSAEGTNITPAEHLELEPYG